MDLLHSDIGNAVSVYAVFSDQAMQEQITHLGQDDAIGKASEVATNVAEVLKQMRK